MNFILGVNYWGKDFGTEMWRHYDGEKIRRELATLYEYGVRYLRVFPNWRDFQPIDRTYRRDGAHGEYINANTGEVVSDDGVDMQQIENLRDFCRAAEETGLKLVLSLVTGWMSGRLFMPPAIITKNAISDNEVLMWTRRYVHRLVKELKNEKAIAMWDLGNECNCMAAVGTRFDAYVWTSTVVDAIRSEDPTRKIASGMHSLHSLTEDPERKWFLQDQGELTDILTTHPYPSPTVLGNNEPYTRLKVTFIPTAQTLYYSGIGKKDAYIQESGTFSNLIGSRKMSADWMRIQILSALTNGLLGYQWWCAWEQKHLDFSPYTWSMVERELGMFDEHGEPKPAAHVMKKMSALIDSLPDPFPKRKSDGVCVLTQTQDHQNTAISTLTLAKQAGFDLDVVYTETGDIPDAELYFMPVISGWNVVNKKTWDALKRKVDEGATLYISYHNGNLTEFPQYVGAESMGLMADASYTFEVDGKKMSYNGRTVLLDPTTAEVVIRTDDGQPLMLKNNVGRGCVYFFSGSLETLAFNTADSFHKIPYYSVYKLVGEKKIESKPIRCDNPNIFVTVNPCEDGSCYATMLNYSDHDIIAPFTIKSGWKIDSILYGSTDKFPSCDGTILKLVKE